MKILTFWTEREDQNLRLADDGSKKSKTSTDEWSLDSTAYSTILERFSLSPTVDTFASSENAKCKVYFSKLPETTTSGVDFFRQKLGGDEIYFVCPPICHIQRAWRKVTQTKGITAIVCIPYWKSHAYFADLLEADNFKPCIKDHFCFKANFVSKSDSCLFNGVTKFDMIALLVKT